MQIKQKIISFVISFLILFFVVELVRRKKLTEEFSVIWLTAAVVIFILALRDELLSMISAVTGIIEPTSIVFFFGIIFLLMVTLHLSISCSQLKNRLKNLVQTVSLQEQEKTVNGRNRHDDDTRK